MAQANRPLSPHLQVYRWYFTMALSIGHRVSGCGLAVGLLLLTWGLTALAGGEESFATVDWWVGNPFGALVLFGYTFILFYHMANGIRHLFWDAGYGFDLEIAQKSGFAVLAAAGGLTVITWLAILIAS